MNAEQTTPEVDQEEELSPPEPQFWQRYSPHHEFPLSAGSSIVLHGLVLAAAIAIGYYLVQSLEAQSSPLPVGAIMIEGGGGGNPGGVEGGKTGITKIEDTGTNSKDKTDPLGKTRITGLVTPTAEPIEIKEPDPTDDKLIAEARLATRNLQDTRQKIIDSLPAIGRGGPGTDGGKDKGKGTGTGDHEGPGWAAETRLGRSMRWHLNLEAADGRDCLRQMAELGIILAVREPDGKYRVFNDLARLPLSGQIEDPRSIKRLPIVDQNPQSVAFLAQALGLPYRPHHVFAFLPQSLEAELVKKELAFRGANEKNIKMTIFRIARQNGKLTPSVIEQQ
ncbi:MAG: hypothetical protein AB7K24_20955 [Gemmataceae bacterium]